MSLTDEIRNAVRKAEGLNLDQLMEALYEGADRNTVSTIANQRVRGGEFLVAVEEGRRVYRPNPDFVPGKSVPKAEGAVPPAATKAKKPRRDTNRETNTKQTGSRKRDFLAACETAEKTLKALKFAADTAADALEVYVHSVADPAIYGALKASRDQSRAALDAFVA